MAFRSGLGIQVNRAISAHLAASTPYFTISGGEVLMTGIIGTITTAPGGACNATLVFNPTTGTTSNLCGLLALAACTSGDIVTISGLASAAMLASHVPCAPMFSATQKGVILGIGDIELLLSTNVGQSKWVMWYIPLTAGASVTAV
jgi:hypothetical protein